MIYVLKIDWLCEHIHISSIICLYHNSTIGNIVVCLSLSLDIYGMVVKHPEINKDRKKEKNDSSYQFYLYIYMYMLFISYICHRLTWQSHADCHTQHTANRTPLPTVSILHILYGQI